MPVQKLICLVKHKMLLKPFASPPLFRLVLNWLSIGKTALVNTTETYSWWGVYTYRSLNMEEWIHSSLQILVSLSLVPRYQVSSFFPFSLFMKFSYTRSKRMPSWLFYGPWKTSALVASLPWRKDSTFQMAASLLQALYPVSWPLYTRICWTLVYYFPQIARDTYPYSPSGLLKALSLNEINWGKDHNSCILMTFSKIFHLISSFFGATFPSPP